MKTLASFVLALATVALLDSAVLAAGPVSPVYLAARGHSGSIFERNPPSEDVLLVNGDQQHAYRVTYIACRAGGEEFDRRTIRIEKGQQAIIGTQGGGSPVSFYKILTAEKVSR